MGLEAGYKDHEEDVDLVKEHTQCRDHQAGEVSSCPSLERHKDRPDEFDRIEPCHTRKDKEGHNFGRRRQRPDMKSRWN